VDPADPRLRIQQDTGTYKGREVLNGAMSDEFFSPLENIRGEGRLLTPAAKEFNKMAKAFEEENSYKLKITDSYRSLERQVEMKRKQLSGQGNPAAVPGTSKHGWGLAVDLGTFDGTNSKFESSIFEWLTNNAYKYNFYHPEWAAKKGSAPEAHHWEYNGDHGLIKK
jgi:LAS superfamily LD-carboxypeptidase LdcB